MSRCLNRGEMLGRATMFSIIGAVAIQRKRSKTGRRVHTHKERPKTTRIAAALTGRGSPSCRLDASSSARSEERQGL